MATFIKGASSLPTAMDGLEDYSGDVETQGATSVSSKEPQSSIEVRIMQVPATPQSPLTKTASIYGNADAIKAQRLHLDSSSFAASCPDIPSHVYQNTADIISSASHEVPSCVVHPPSTPDRVISSSSENNLKSTEVSSQMVELESNSSVPVTPNNADITSHTYYNTSDLVGKESTPKQSPVQPTVVKSNTFPVAKQAPGDYAHLIDVIKYQFPHIANVVITEFLIRSGGNAEEAMKDIKLCQLTAMKLEGITEADCRTILEQCNWDLSKAAEILCS